MIVELPREVHRDVIEFDCGDMGKLKLTCQQIRALGIPARQIAERYVSMIEQGCPVDLARQWAEGKVRARI